MSASGEGAAAAAYSIDRGRDEPLHADPIGAALGAAMLSWCNVRDRKALRRLILRALTELEDDDGGA